MKRPTCLLLALALLLAATPVWAQSVVQDTPVANAASSTSVTVTFPVATTAGNLIVCAVVINDAGGCCAPVTLTDNASGGLNTYTNLTAMGTSGSGRGQGSYTANAKSVTTVTATASGSSAYLSLACAEVAGAATSTPLDGSNQRVQYANPVDSDTITTTNAMTSSSASRSRATSLAP